MRGFTLVAFMTLVIGSAASADGSFSQGQSPRNTCSGAGLKTETFIDSEGAEHVGLEKITLDDGSTGVGTFTFNTDETYLAPKVNVVLNILSETLVKEGEPGEYENCQTSSGEISERKVAISSGGLGGLSIPSKTISLVCIEHYRIYSCTKPDDSSDPSEEN